MSFRAYYWCLIGIRERFITVNFERRKEIKQLGSILFRSEM